MEAKYRLAQQSVRIDRHSRMFPVGIQRLLKTPAPRRKQPGVTYQRSDHEHEYEVKAAGSSVSNCQFSGGPGGCTCSKPESTPPGPLEGDSKQPYSHLCPAVPDVSWCRPGVQEAGQDVHHEIDGENNEGEQQEATLEHWIIAVHARLVKQGPHTVDGKDDLNQK